MTGKQALKALYETMPLVFEESRKATHYLEIIEKEIKVLEILKKYYRKTTSTFILKWIMQDIKDLTSETEFNLIKDVLTQK